MGRVGVDWGGSSFRAYLFDDGLELVEARTADRGIKGIAGNGFEAVLKEHIGDWLEPGTEVVLSGMITSRNGWHETPYISIPTTLGSLPYKSKKVAMDECSLLFLPGLCVEAPSPDVIRGEELQLLGVIEKYRPETVVLPGTHSKWVSLDKDEVVNFKTIITGELFELLRHQSLVGQLASGTETDGEAFELGVSKGFESTGIVADLFSSRSGVLLNQLKASSVHSYLSGLLIGHEIHCGMKASPISTGPAVIVGNESLAYLYHQALTLLQFESTIAETNITAVGFQSLFTSLDL